LVVRTLKVYGWVAFVGETTSCNGIDSNKFIGKHRNVLPYKHHKDKNKIKNQGKENEIQNNLDFSISHNVLIYTIH